MIGVSISQLIPTSVKFYALKCIRTIDHNNSSDLGPLDSHFEGSHWQFKCLTTLVYYPFIYFVDYCPVDVLQSC